MRVFAGPANNREVHTDGRYNSDPLEAYDAVSEKGQPIGIQRTSRTTAPVRSYTPWRAVLAA